MSHDLDQIGPSAHLTEGQLLRPPALCLASPAPLSRGGIPVRGFLTPPAESADLSPQTPLLLLRSNSLS